jgi:hypothetical protein
MRQIFRPQPHERRFFPPAGLTTGFEIAGQTQKTNADAAMAGYQAQVARQNQTIAEGYAKRAEQQGLIDAQNQRFKTASLIGAQRAALASQGGDIDSGSPLDIVGDTARAGEFDSQTIRNNAALKAYGYRVQAFNNAADAGRYDLSAANTMAALPYAIGSTLLGEAKSMARYVV